MNRFIFGVMVGCSVLMIASVTDSAQEGKSAVDGQAAPVVKQTARISSEVIEREKAVRKWRAKLSGTEWELELKPMRGKSGKTQKDVLTFGRSSIGSEKLLKAGYSDSKSYTLYAPTEESISWETMQLKDGDDETDMAIWRGEIIDNKIQGTLTKQRSLGDANLVEQYSFVGSLIEPAPEIVPPTAEDDASSSTPASS